MFPIIPPNSHSHVTRSLHQDSDRKMLNACLLLLIMGSLMMMFTFMWWWCQWSGIWRYESHNRVFCRNLLSGVNIWGGGTSLRRDSNKNLFRKSSRGVDWMVVNLISFVTPQIRNYPPRHWPNGGITQKYNTKHLHNYTRFNSVSKKHQDSHREWKKLLKCKLLSRLASG